MPRSADNTQLTLEVACFELLKTYFTAAFFGKRRTGKTTWAKTLLQCVKFMSHRVIVFCGNKDCEGEWLKILPRSFVVPKDLEYLRSIVAYQNDIANEYKDAEGGIPLRYRLTVVFDDCGSDKSFMHSSVMNDLMANGRHYGMYTVFLLQYLTQLHPQNRCQLDYAGILATNNLKNLKTLHSEYGGNCSLNIFMRIVSAATNDYGVCWVDNTIHVPYDPSVVNVGNLFYNKTSLVEVDIDAQLCPQYIIDACEDVEKQQLSRPTQSGGVILRSAL